MKIISQQWTLQLQQNWSEDVAWSRSGKGISRRKDCMHASCKCEMWCEPLLEARPLQWEKAKLSGERRSGASFNVRAWWAKQEQADAAARVVASYMEQAQLAALG